MAAAGRWGITIGVATAICALLGAGLWWLLLVRPVEAALRRGVAIVADAPDASALSAALGRWQAELAGATRLKLAARLIEFGAWNNPARAVLLQRLSGADFGTRAADWQRWLRGQRRLHSAPLNLDAQEGISLSERWRAPIGATQGFSGILPIDGAIFIAGLGRGLDLPGDDADGVVRVEGASGESRTLFVPPDGATRDVLGVAACQETLIVVSRAGFVYGVTFDGQQRWSAALGAPAGSIPLIVDRGMSVALATSAGRVFKLSAATGKTIWTTVVEPQPAFRAKAPIAFGLAAAGADRARGAILVASAASGTLYALRAEDARLLWKQPGASRAGASASSAAGTAGAGSLVAQISADGRLRTLQMQPGGVRAIDFSFGAALNPPLLTPPRWLAPRPGFSGGWLACGAAEDQAGVLALSDASGLVWRNHVPGALSAPPACADLNGDHRPEIIAVSDDADVARLTILSARGLWLRSERLDAPAHAAPVVADVDGDGRLELLFADADGWLHCRATGRSGPVVWGMLAGDPYNSGVADSAFSYSQVPFGYQSRWRPEP